MTSIAVIVCGHTLDRWDDITKALDSVRGQTRPADQIIFSVDNNAELYQAASAAFTDIMVVHNTGRRGVSGARNAAAWSTTCDVLAYLDDDAAADDHWLEQLVRWYDDPEIVGVGGHAEPAWDGVGPRWFPPSFNWVVGCSHSGIADTPGPVRNFIGCNMSIRSDAWRAVGGFDESIGRVGADGGGGDETDFCIRVTEKVGGVVMNDPSAIVSHRVPAARQTWSYFIKRCRSEGRSKAQIAAEAGTDLALQAERGHLIHELPKSFIRGLGDALRGDMAGLGRSTAIVVGTGATGLGYLTGRLSSGSKADDETVPGFTPVQIAVVDLDETPLALPLLGSGEPAMLIIKRGARLLGIDQVEGSVSSDELAARLGAEYPAVDAAPVANRYDGSAAVVIATRDRTDSLQRTLQSLGALRRKPDQIIVVDNAPSTNETQAMIADWRSPGMAPIHYVRCDQPGLAPAHNAAIEHLTTDIVAFTDDDVIVDEHWLDQLLAGFGQGPAVACVTGTIVPAEIQTWPQAWVEATSNYSKGFAGASFSLEDPPDDPLFPFTAGSMGSGANMAFRTDWLVAHPFHEALGVGTKALGGDDLRAFYDVIASGETLVFAPDAMVLHHHHRTAKAIDRLAHGYGAGLTAFFTSVVVDDPRTAFHIIARAPRALRHARSISSPLDVSSGQSFPGDRRRSTKQRFGMASGPLRYLRSRF